jgi:hypothetical protein
MLYLATDQHVLVQLPPNDVLIDAGDLTALQHADVAVLAAILALLPIENADESEQDTDEQGLGACVRLTCTAASGTGIELEAGLAPVLQPGHVLMVRLATPSHDACALNP